MKNYKITCPSIFIAWLVHEFLYNNQSLIPHHSIKVVQLITDWTLEELYELFAGTPFDIVIQELDDNGNLVKQRMTP